MEIAKWAKFIAIVMIVFSVFVAFSGILGATIGPSDLMSLEERKELNSMKGYEFIGIGIGYAIFLFTPNFFLLRFSNRAITSLRSGDENKLIEAFMNLKSYFKFNGVVMLIGVVIYTFILIVFGYIWLLDIFSK